MADYIKVLEEYFHLIENLQEYSKYGFLKECGRLLPLIYSMTLTLPDSEGSDSDIDIDRSELGKPMGDIISFLGKHDIYHEVYDPLVDEETVVGSIADDLTDIYRDLKEGYLKFISGTEEGIQDAIWDWKFSIRSHFGNHLVDVMRPIQRLIMDQLNEED